MLPVAMVAVCLAWLGLFGLASFLPLPVAIGLGVCLDVVSLVLDVRKIRRGPGASGIPIIPLVFYAVAVARAATVLPWAWTAGIGLALALTYWLCHYVMPARFDRHYTEKRMTGETPVPPRPF